MSGDGQAVIEQIYQMGVAPGTEAAAAGAWARAGSGGALPSTIVATFNGLEGGIPAPEGLVAEWASEDLPEAGQPVGAWRDQVSGIDWVASGPTLVVEEGSFSLDGLNNARGARLFTGLSLAAAGNLMTDPMSLVMVVQRMGDSAGRFISNAGAGADLVNVNELPSNYRMNVAGVDTTLGPTFLGQQLIALRLAAGLQESAAIASALQNADLSEVASTGFATPYFNGLISEDVDARIFGLAIVHSDTSQAMQDLIRYMQGKYVPLTGA